MRVFLLGVTVLFFVACLSSCNKKDDGPDTPPAATITSIDPKSGPVGTQVTITGSNFSKNAAANVVSFNGTAAQVSSVTETTIVTTVPAGATTGNVTVTVDGNPVVGETFTVTVPEPDDLSISSIEPTSGTVGTEVTITGENLGATPADNIVKFHNGVSAEIISVDASTIIAKVPEGAETGPITLQVGDKIATSATFTVIETAVLAISSVDPTSGPVGTEVTITGTGFSPSSGENVVKFTDGAEGVAATVTSATDTEIKISVPEGATTGVIMVTVDDETVESGEFTVTVPPVGVYSYTVSKVAGRSSLGGPIDGPAQNAQFHEPFGLAIDADGNILIGDRLTHRVRKLSADLTTVSTFAGSVMGNKDGVGTEAEFNEPTGLAFGADGTLYVGAPQNKSVRQVSPTAEVSLLAGSGQGGVVDGTGAAARFSNPYAVFVNRNDEIIVADFDGHTLRKVTKEGVVSTYAGGANTPGTADGSLTEARFNKPYFMAEDADGNLYVSDFENHRIRKITPEGVVSTFAGSTEGHADGMGSVAQFNNPAGLAVDVDGNVYVADRANHVIRKISPEGEVTTVAGVAGESGVQNGLGTEARFNEPNGMVMDNEGNLYVSDRLSGNIRKIVISLQE